MLYAFLLTSAFFAGGSLAAERPRRIPRLTIAVALILATAFAFQLVHPAALALMERNASLVFAGEWWRLGTAFFFQDGGTAGFLFNLIAFGFIGSVAEEVWERREWAVVLIVSAFLAECAALWWQPIGSGNSVGIFGLAGSVCAAAFAARRGSGIALAALSAACGLLLILQTDIHGAAFFAGFVIAFALITGEGIA